MEILFKNITYTGADSSQFVIKDNGKFYLVNIDTQSAIEAKPADRPDMFFKWAAFEEAKRIPKNTEAAVIEIYTKWKPQTKGRAGE
jgi:hypothetical protein